jgi:c-di-GMP-binding flagellar brake protein YcgR
MGVTTTADRRMHPRHPLATSVQFHHAPSRRQFPGRCVDISAGGMKMYIPASTPVQPGHSVQLQMGSVNRPELAGLGAGPVSASVVRVDRHNLLANGHLAVGLRFT